jgi:hypothetical protein
MIPIAACSALTGFLMLAATGSSALFYFGCFCTTFACGFHAIKSIYYGRLNIGALISSQTMMWHTLPFSYIWMFGYRGYNILNSELQNAESTAISVVVLCIIFCVAEKMGIEIAIDRSKIKFRRMIFALLPVVACQIYLILTGESGYAYVVGAYYDRELSLTYQIINSLSIFVLPASSLALAEIISERRVRPSAFMMLLVSVVIIVQFAWWSTAGRRPLTIIVLISLVSLASRLLKGQRIKKFTFPIALALLVSLPGVWFFWESYYVLRMATNAVNGAENLSILDLSRARQLASGAVGDAGFAANIVERPFETVTSLTTVRNTSTGFLWGWNGLSQALLTIPSALFPGKIAFIGPVIENLWAVSLGLSGADIVNTIVLDSYVDFGWLGVPLYIAIFSVICGGVFKLSVLSRSNMTTGFCYFTILFTALNSETTLVTSFTALRTALVITFLVLSVRLFIRKRSGTLA